MRIASFLRHLAVLAAVALLVWPAGAAPGQSGPSHLGQPDEVPIGRINPPDCDSGDSQSDAPSDDGRDTGEDSGSTKPGDDDASNDRDSKRVKVSVRRRVRLDLANDSRVRTRARARATGQSARTFALVRTILRRR